MPDTACFTISDYSHLQKVLKLCLTGVSGFQFQHDRKALHQITSSAALAASRLAVMVLVIPGGAATASPGSENFVISWHSIFVGTPLFWRREEGRVGGAKLGVVGAGLGPRRGGLACSGQPGPGGWNGKVGGRRTAISALEIRKQSVRNDWRGQISTQKIKVKASKNNHCANEIDQVLHRRK